MLRYVHNMMLSAALLLPLAVAAQETVAPCTDWLATVDETSGLIVLRWRPSADSAAMGYHICTGTPCLDYDTVFGRLDTSYVCLDHSPLEEHTYRLHVFDTAYNVSSLTEAFGNMVLQAEVPECDPMVNVEWTPYRGMPGGVARYDLLMLTEPLDSVYSVQYYTGQQGPTSYSFQMPVEATRVHIKVQAVNGDGTLVSQSNVVSVDRRTVDTAAFVEIVHVGYDTLMHSVQLDFNIDTAYHAADHYTLWRSVDYSPWRVLDNGNWLHYADSDVNLYDSLYCYQLSVYDGCGLNEKFSATACPVVPDPPQPGVYVPNIVIVGSEVCGLFLPVVAGLDDLYELNVFNRNGIQVFATDVATEGWRPSASVPQGAYTYVLRVRYVSGVVQSYVGTVLVIK